MKNIGYSSAVLVGILLPCFGLAQPQSKMNQPAKFKIIIFTLELKKETYKLECRFTDAENAERDSYYVYVSYLGM